MRKRILMCGGRKRPQNSKVGAESAPKMSKWGQKVPPQFGHEKIRTEVKIKVGAESAPKKSSPFLCVNSSFSYIKYVYAAFIFSNVL